MNYSEVHFDQNRPGSPENRLLVSDNSLPETVGMYITMTFRKIQMTAFFAAVTEKNPLVSRSVLTN